MKVAIITTDLRDDHRRYDEPEPSFGAAPTALLEGFAHIGGCEVHVISCVQKPVASPIRTFGSLFYHSVQVGKAGWLRGGYLGCILGVRRKLRQINPDIVHGQGTERYCALSAVFSGFPNVLTIHGNMRMVAKVNRAAPFTFEWLAARLETLALPKSSGVFCNSAYTENAVAPLAKKTWRVGNALRSEFFREDCPTPAEEPPALLNVGVVCPRKQQVALLSLAERLHRQDANFRLKFIGAVDPSDAYGVQFCSRMTIAEAQGYCQYIGTRSGDALLKSFDSASALIHCPSEEAFGLVVAEALARNLKVFGFRTGGIEDIAAGVDGVELVEADDWAGLATVVDSWLKSGHARPLLAAAEMNRRYHPSVIAQRHLEIYREVLSNSKVL